MTIATKMIIKIIAHASQHAGFSQIRSHMKSIKFIKIFVVPTSDACIENQLFGASGMSYHSGSQMAAYCEPACTYGELIRMLCEAEADAVENEKSESYMLTSKFSLKYPHIPISRPRRFYDTVKRIAAPTRPSAIGEARLSGSPLRSYLKRHWAPRIRNTKQGGIIFWDRY